MSIQASLNQLLGTAAIGAGIYAQTPAAKEKAEVRGLKRSIAQMQKVSGSQMEEAEFPTSPEAQEAVRQEAAATQRLAQLRPTEENLKQAAGARELRATLDELREAETEEKEAVKKAKADAKKAKAEEAALASQTEAQEQRRNQAEALDIRKISLQQVEELRAAGAISNKEAKSLTYKINKFGGNN